MNTALASAARAMLDAFGGDFPDHLRGEAAALADELAAIEGEAEGPHMAAIAHMRAAERFAREIGDRRLFKHVRAAVEAVEAHAVRLVLPVTAEAEREAQRLAEWPDPLPPEGGK
jgi:hypothetical protein